MIHASRRNGTKVQESVVCVEEAHFIERKYVMLSCFSFEIKMHVCANLLCSSNLELTGLTSEKVKVVLIPKKKGIRDSNCRRYVTQDDP